jgi:hypothetical protein
LPRLPAGIASAFGPTDGKPYRAGARQIQFILAAVLLPVSLKSAADSGTFHTGNF